MSITTNLDAVGPLDLKSNNSSALTPPTSRYLDWTQRPNDVQLSISKSFDRLASATSSWYYNGSKEYGMCGVNEHALLKKIIQQAPATQKDFYALDIGAGEFQWSTGLADYIEKQPDFPRDIKVHIIGIRGEKSDLGSRVVETDRCKIYNLGAFKVEEIFTKFREQALDIENKIDLAISRWCFRHLVDPVGTFAQTYNLLRPERGFLLMDGFFFLYENDAEPVACNEKMTQLFLDTTAPFLSYFYNISRSLNHFMLRRPDNIPCQLSMSYLGTRSLFGNYQVESRQVTRFRREPQKADEEELYKPNSDDNYSHVCRGNKSMYDWLKKSELLDEKFMVWEPLQAKDSYQTLPPLHQAIQQGEYHKVNEYLNRGDEIDASDYKGCTALHVAIQKGAYDVFELLISQGAHLELSNGKGHTPLHTAAIYDTEGKFLHTLLNAGVQVKEEIHYREGTPLKCASRAKNLKAIEILTEAERKVSKKDCA